MWEMEYLLKTKIGQNRPQVGAMKKKMRKVISTKSYAKVASQTFFLGHRKKVFRESPKSIQN